MAGKLFVLKALSYDLLQNLSEPLGIRALATVEPKTLFVKIPEQVERFNAYIRALDRSLVHHSDRGVQYAAGDYTQLLGEHKIQISMSRRGNPYDNAQAESFMKTLKYEEVYRPDYRDQREVRSAIGRFLKKVYNEKRLHSALSYVPPAELERSLIKTKAAEARA